MTQNNSLKCRMCCSQLNKWESGIKRGTEVPLKLSSNVIDESNDKTNFPHKPFLTNRQAASLRKNFCE